jgi:hypothetical protein
MTASLHKPHIDDARPPETRAHRISRRALTLVVILLLIGIPAAVLVVAAQKSHESGRKSAKEALATGLQKGRPPAVKKRIYDVPVPAGATHVRYYETSNWKDSRLYTQFDVTSGRLDTFLTQLGAGRAGLRPGAVTIPERDQHVVGWKFAIPGHQWAGLSYKQKSPLPSVNVVADLSDPASPRVYVVSTATP